MEHKKGEKNNKGMQKFVKIKQAKLPLAHIDSTRIDKKPNATRRGVSIFSPTKVHQQPKPEPDPAQTASPSTPCSPSLKNPPPELSNGVEIKYRECLKNHFAKSGGHVVDGCGEFMPGGDVGTEESLICDACDCHRNFHRKEVVPLPTPSSNPPNNACVSGPKPSKMVNFGGGEGSESSGEEQDVSNGGDGGKATGTNKRFRTKFSTEQKDLMNKMAVKLGWRIQKQDEEEVERACGEIGVSREVFRVFMNNCKQAAKRRRRV